MRTIYLCDDTIIGIYSALYQAWVRSRDEDVGIEFHNHSEQQLFAQYHVVDSNRQHALKMESFIKKHLGLQSYREIYHALIANDSYKAEAVFKTMQEAREIQDSHKIMQHLTNADVAKVFELSRRVGNESHLYCGFVRFRELKNSVMYAEISPNSQVLTCIADYFTDRFPEENWMIYDKSHHIYLVHQKSKDWMLVQGYELDQDILDDVTDGEKEYEQLWQNFHKTISIKERENPRAQRNHLPKRFRGNMLEFRI